MAFNRFLKAMHSGVPITLYGDGEQTRDFTFVDDAVSATVAAGHHGVPGRVYNIGGGSRVSMNEVLTLMKRCTGFDPIVNKEESQNGDMRDTYADTELAKQDLDFAPSVTLEQGIETEYKWLSDLTP